MAKVNDHINAHFQQLEEKLTTSSVPTASTTSIPSKTSQITETMATHVIDEYRDRETRKLNIIIHNALESTATEPSVRIAHDTKSVADIAKSIDAGPVDIVNITRLGKKLDGRSRLMKVQLSNLNQKRKILSNTKKLRESSSSFQKVYVTPDLSLNERRENKRLRDELLQRKKDGEKDLIIQRGKIVKKANSVEPNPPSAAMDTTQSAATNDQNG